MEPDGALSSLFERVKFRQRQSKLQIPKRVTSAGNGYIFGWTGGNDNEKSMWRTFFVGEPQSMEITRSSGHLHRHAERIAHAVSQISKRVGVFRRQSKKRCDCDIAVRISQFQKSLQRRFQVHGRNQLSCLASPVETDAIFVQPRC